MKNAFRYLPTWLRSMLMAAIVLSASAAGSAQAGDEARQSEDAAASDAEGSDSEAPAAGPSIYLPIKPSFTVNFGPPGRLRYLKTDVSVRMRSVDAANSLRYHLPFVRNDLVKLFSAQTTATVSSQAGKENIRTDALAVIRDILAREDGVPSEDVVGVYFNNFIVQK